MNPILFEMEAGLPLFTPLCQQLDADPGSIACRQFPDGETYLRVRSDVTGRNCILLANLSPPDAKFLPLAFLADTLRELGAASVGLVAPYLCYMRQDCRFHPGEAVTSRTFAHLISNSFDWLATVDPHLHRYRSLGEIYSMPTQAVGAAPAVAQWIARHGQDYLLIGPDAESAQWLQAIARHTQLPFLVGEKQRSGDREVKISLPGLASYRQRPVLIIDDVISSGHTLLETVDLLRAEHITAIDCIAVHGVFAENADRKLLQRGIQTLVTGNSIPNPHGNIDLSGILAAPIATLMNEVRRRGETKK